MIKLFGKYKNDAALWLGLTASFWLMRLWNLTILPVFVDEAIYLRWSQVMRDPNWRFIPLTDGKQPLFMWLAAFPVNLLPDPLFAGRLISVIAGFFGMIGIWFLGKELFSKPVAYLAAALYITIPFFTFYDRLSVADGLLTVLGIWSLYLAVVLVRRVRLDLALLLGMAIGAATLTKSPGFFYLLLLPTTILLFDFRHPQWGWRLAKLLALWLVVAALTELIYNVLRLSPYFYLIGQRTWDFVLTPREVMQNGLLWWLQCRGAYLVWGCGRVFEVTEWLNGYFTAPIFAIACFSLLVLIVKKWRVGLVLAAWSIVPLVVESTIAKGFTARYIIFASFPFIISAAAGLWWLEVRLSRFNRFAVLAVFLVLVPAMVFDFFLVTDPTKAAIVQKERSGYLEQWSAGYGILEIAHFLQEKAKEGKPILVGTEGTFGTLPDGLQIYTRDMPNVTVVGMGQNADIYVIPPDLRNAAKEGHLAYLVVNKSRLHAANDKSLRLLATYPRPRGPEGQEELLLYQLISP